MSTLFQQADYGGFDPKFLGINLRFHSQNLRAWDLFGEILRNSAEPARMMASGDAAIAGDEDAALDFFSLATVIPHELRHFHDFLLSPYGNCLFRKRVHAALNSTQLVARIMSERTTIPVPIPKWQEKSDEERFRLAKMFGHMMGRDVPADPLTFPDDTRRMWDQLQSLYSQIRSLVANPRNQWSQPDRIHPSHVFEASALLVQLQSVYTTFGAEHATFFLKAVCRGTRHPFELFDNLAALWHHRELVADSNVMGPVLTWSILGDPTHDGWDAAPVPRFARVFMKLMKEGLPSAKPAAELFGEWDAEFAQTPYYEALGQNAKLNSLLIERLEGVVTDNRDHPLSTTFSELVEAMRMLERAHHIMADRFLANPDHYARPWPYQESIHDWVAAPIAVEFFGSGLQLLPGEDQSQVIRAIQRADGSLLVQRMLFPDLTPGQRIIDPDIASNIAYELLASDFFFSTFRRDDPDFEPLRRIIAEGAHRCPEVLM